MRTLATIDTTPQGDQMDLFKLFYGLYGERPQSKESNCLDCQTNKVTRFYDVSQGIYSGLRTCAPCLGKEKRKYFTF